MKQQAPTIHRPERMTSTPTISIDLDGVVMQNPFDSGVWPRVMEHLRRHSTLASLTNEEAEAHALNAVQSLHYQRMAAGDFVGAYDWDAIYSQVSCDFGAGPVPDIAGLVRECCQIEGLSRLLPGARNGLERLRTLSLRLVALTNGFYAYQWPVLQVLGVAELFDAVVSPDKAGYAKPDARIFQALPGLVAHVGDTLMHDVLGANQAGVMSLWLDAALPSELRDLPIEQRTQAPEFARYLAAAFETAPYREIHQEATLALCTPGAVVVDLDEAATLLLGRFT